MIFTGICVYLLLAGRLRSRGTILYVESVVINSILAEETTLTKLLMNISSFTTPVLETKQQLKLTTTESLTTQFSTTQTSTTQYFTTQSQTTIPSLSTQSPTTQFPTIQSPTTVSSTTQLPTTHSLTTMFITTESRTTIEFVTPMVVSTPETDRLLNSSIAIPTTPNLGTVEYFKTESKIVNETFSKSQVPTEPAKRDNAGHSVASLVLKIFVAVLIFLIGIVVIFLFPFKTRPKHLSRAVRSDINSKNEAVSQKLETDAVLEGEDDDEEDEDNNAGNQIDEEQTADTSDTSLLTTEDTTNTNSSSKRKEGAGQIQLALVNGTIPVRQTAATKLNQIIAPEFRTEIQLPKVVKLSALPAGRTAASGTGTTSPGTTSTNYSKMDVSCNSSKSVNLNPVNEKNKCYIL